MADLKTKAARAAKENLEWMLFDIEQLYQIKLDDRIVKEFNRVVDTLSKDIIKLVKNEIADL